MSASAISEEQRRQIEQYLRRDFRSSSGEQEAILRRSPGHPVPLTSAQLELWQRELRVPQIPPLYNECITVRMLGPLDVAAVEQSFTEIIRRHEAWRTTFEQRNGQPVQNIFAPAQVRLPILDLTVLPETVRDAEAVRLIGEDARRPFDMQVGPLLRPTLVKINDAEYRLYLIAHQIIIDGMSAYQIFPCELAAIYKALIAGRPSPLPELSIQFADFACWQRQWLQGEVLASQVDYWRNQLRNAAPLNWPNSRPRPTQRSFRGAFQPFSFPASLAAALRELGRSSGVTLFMTLLAGLATLLHTWTRHDDIVLGTLSPAGRKRSEVQRLLGYFLNPVALRLDFKGRPTFRDLLRQVRTTLSEAISHDDVPLEFLASQLKLETDPSRAPLFNVAVSLQPPTPDLGLNWSVTSMDVESGGASWDLYIAFIERPDRLLGRAQYNPDLFDQPAIRALLSDLQKVLEVLTRHPDEWLSEIISRRLLPDERN